MSSRAKNPLHSTPSPLHSISAPAYTRENKQWRNLVGKTGTVLLATTIRVTSPEHAAFAPYMYAIVQLDSGEKKAFMVAAQERVKPGDRVRCVLRKLANPSKTGIIRYGVKITAQDICPKLKKYPASDF